MHDGSDVWSRTKKGWRVGQREQGMEMWGGSEEREDRRMLEEATNGNSCEDVKPKKGGGIWCVLIWS